MKYPRPKACLPFLVGIVFAGCKANSTPTATVKGDAPQGGTSIFDAGALAVARQDALWDDAAKSLAGKLPFELDSTFLASSNPTGIDGCYVGTHLAQQIPTEPAGMLPAFNSAPNVGWHGKCFDSGQGMMQDVVAQPGTGGNVVAPYVIKAALYTNSSVKAQFGRSGASPDFSKQIANFVAGTGAISAPAPGTTYVSPVGFDLSESLVTDYRLGSNPPAVQPWVDEFRQLAGRPDILLGRSTYAGQFWGYVVLQKCASAASCSPPDGQEPMATPTDPASGDSSPSGTASL